MQSICYLVLVICHMAGFCLPTVLQYSSFLNICAEGKRFKRQTLDQLMK